MAIKIGKFIKKKIKTGYKEYKEDSKAREETRVMARKAARQVERGETIKQARLKAKRQVKSRYNPSKSKGDPLGDVAALFGGAPPSGKKKKKDVDFDSFFR